VSSCPDVHTAPGPGRRIRGDESGFTLIEVLVSTLVLTIGLVGIAGLLTVTTMAQVGARESARSVRLAQTKLDEIMKLPFADARISVGGDLAANVANHNSTPVPGVTVRWLVAAGPTDDTRVVTVRVVNMRAQQYRNTQLSSIVREW
jgi:prepilin-type N-terminal cleavage/methylation domain-containing protein